MTVFVENLITGLENELKSITTEENNSLRRAEQSIFKTQEALLRLREFIIAYTFTSTAEEVFFFKELKPLIVGKLIYFNSVFNIASKMPAGSNKTQRKYLENELDKISYFFENNLEFYQYYRAKHDALDDKYFVRGKQDVRLYLENIYSFYDTQFSTSHDHTVAKIIAYDQLQPH
ncbi:MAG: RteC domain-containing protein [Verrucomicrobia bacterium]|nr:RteC domain-containing protein [Cytophagales bacterium]